MTNGHSSMEIDDNDELLYEIDVKLHRPKESLYLFQYPIRPHFRKYDETSFISARIKDKYSLVEMDLYIDRQSTNYSNAKGKQFADATNSDNNKKQFFNSDHMDKQTIASSHTLEGDRYFVGLFDGVRRSITLCPVKSIVQLRPQFNYLDTALSTATGPTSTKEPNSIDDDMANASDGEQSGSETEETKPDPVGSLVTMKFEKKESEYHRKKQLQSYDYFRQTRDNERWKDFECIMNPHSFDALRIREQLTSK